MKGETIEIEIDKEKSLTYDYMDVVYNNMFDKNNSFYKLYDKGTYDKLIELENDNRRIFNIIESSDYKSCKKYIIPYLLENRIFFDKKDINKIPNTISQLNNNIIDMDNNYIKKIGVALAIEEYYNTCRKFIKECPDYPSKFPLPIFDPCEYPHVLTLYNHFYNYCRDQRQLHSLAGGYFSKLNKYFLVPSIFFACFGSVFSFISSACFIHEYQRDILSIFVGVTSCIVALLQSLISAYQFDAKSSHHQNSADLYDQLLTSIDFEKNYPNNTSFFSDLEKDIIKIKSNCPFLVPGFIKKKYYNKKDKLNYESFIKKNLIKPARSEILESIQTGNKKLTLNDNLEYYKNKIIEMGNLEKELLSEDKLPTR